KLPIHLEHTREQATQDNVGLLVREPARATTLAYFPGVADAAPGVRDALEIADCVFFDGTFWSDDELGALGLGDKRARDMAHWPLGDANGSLAWLAKLPAGRRVLIHINNT